MSLILVGSMVVSLIIVALPSGPGPTPTPTPEVQLLPTVTPTPRSTRTPMPTLPAPPSLTPADTEPVLGPTLPTETPAVAPSDILSPTLSPTAASLDVDFALCGDSRANPSVFSQVLAAVVEGGAEFLIHTGDLVNEGTEAQWREFERVIAGFPIPFYPVPGNHDALGGKLDGFLAHSGAPGAHYSFDVGSVHLTLADSHHGGVTAGELAWIAQDLAATTQPVKIVALHHPPFDPDGTDHIMAFGNRAFMDLMVEQDVGHVFAGHIHAFAQEERDGVLYTITGGAGAPVYGSDHPKAFYHFLSVSVRGEEVVIQVVRI